MIRFIPVLLWSLKCPYFGCLCYYHKYFMVKSLLTTYTSFWTTLNFKFFIGNLAESAENFDIPNLLIHHYGISVSFLSEKLDFQSNVSKNVPLKYNHHKTRKHLFCFVHWYMVTSLGISQESGDLNLKMYQSESLMEQPDYFLFFEDIDSTETNQDQNNRKWFFTEAITDLFVTKPAIHINSMSNISIICITCLDSHLKVLDVSKILNINQLQKYWLIVYSNLQGVFIDTSWSRYKWMIFDKVNCAAFAGNHILFQQNYTIPNIRCIRFLENS